MAAILGPLEGFSVAGTGVAFPRRTWTNLEVLQGLPSAAWGRRAPDPHGEQLAFMAESLEATQGVHTRAWAHVPWEPLDHAQEETVVDLAVAAARQALQRAGVAAADVAMLFCSTSTPHRMTATVSAAVGHALGLTAACQDVRTGCAGGLFALAGAVMAVQALQRPVLLVGTETFSKVIPIHKLAATSLGDGAGALVLVPGQGVLCSAWMQTDGGLGRIITTDGALPPTQAELERGGYLLGGSPEELMTQVPGKYVEAITGALKRAGLTSTDVDLHVPHQSGKSTMEEVARALSIPWDRTVMTLPRHANIGVPGWMVALSLAVDAGRLKAGNTVLFSAVGGGMSWAAAVMRWA